MSTWILIVLCNVAVCGEASLQVAASTATMEECVAYGEDLYETEGYSWLCSRVYENQVIDTKKIVEYHYADE